MPWGFFTGDELRHREMASLRMLRTCFGIAAISESAVNKPI